MKLFFINLLSITLITLFSGCGENGTAAPQTTNIGSIIYGPAQGVSVVCSSGATSYTNEKGQYSCNEGDNVSFYLGTVPVTTMSTKNRKISPYDFFPNDPESALNYTRLLQSLNNTSTKRAQGAIVINQLLVAKLSNTTDFSSKNFEDEIESRLNVELMSLKQTKKLLNQAILDAGESVPLGENIPVANAGKDTNSTSFENSLDGSKSFDLDNDRLSFSWSILSQPQNSNVTITKPNEAISSFITDTEGQYIFSLIISDASSSSEVSSVTINIKKIQKVNTPPIANAGEDSSVKVGSLVTLQATKSSDVDADSLSYKWKTVQRPNNSSASLSSLISSTPFFTADKAGTYRFELTVNDGISDSLVDSVTITAVSNNTNTPPIANAGANQTVSTGSIVQLDATQSSDADANTLTYKWSLSSIAPDSNATLLDATSPTPSFKADVDGTYSLTLIVNDGFTNSSSVSIIITATTKNIAPIANAGTDKNVNTGDVISLNASQSSDANGDTLSYTWSINSIPITSSATLSSLSTINPTFVADVDGVYIFNLIVNDASFSSVIDSVKITASTPNRAPIANAGANDITYINQSYTLDASASSDPDGNSLTYSWSISAKPASSTISLSSSTTVSSNFIADVAGSYTFSLIVNDSLLSSLADSVTITVANSAPIANAGINQNVQTLSTINLDATASSDVDGDTLTYLWTLDTKPLASGAALITPNTITPNFTPDIDGSYIFSLVVNDGTTNSTPSSVTITSSTANSAPIANANNDQLVATGSVVTLDASLSSDVNGDLLTYLWNVVSIPATTSVTLSDTTASNPYFTAYVDGNYTFELIVNDGSVNSVADSVVIYASTGNSAPIANAGVDQNVQNSALVTLDASASSDADNDTLTYTWSLTSSPFAVSLSSPSSVNPSFTPLIDGVYTFQLLVNDSTINSAPDSISVTVSTANSAPVANAGVDDSTYVNQALSLNGLASSDADTDPLTYTWTIFSKPALSTTASFSDANIATPTFTPDVSGSYVLELIVNDGTVDSVGDKVTITAIALQAVKVTAQTSTFSNGDDGFYQNGVATDYALSSDIVTDSVTGLMWQDDNPTVTNLMRGDVADAYCDGLIFGGFSDWRMPTPKELLSLANREMSYPAIDTTVFRSMATNAQVWSSVTVGSSDRRLIDFDLADESWTNESFSRQVRCVRGVSENALIQRDAVNEVVIDYQSKLIWQDNTTPSTREWVDAINYCEALSLNGSSNWRLPNMNELLTIIDFKNSSNIYINVFNYNSSEAWSSTTNLANTSKAFSVTFESIGLFAGNRAFINPDESKTSSLFNNTKKSPKCVMTLP